MHDAATMMETSTNFRTGSSCLRATAWLWMAVLSFLSTLRRLRMHPMQNYYGAAEVTVYTQNVNFSDAATTVSQPSRLVSVLPV